MNIEMQPVQSTHIAEVGYDRESQTLALKYRSGGVYHYKKVPEDVASALVSAKSIGAYVQANILYKYHFTKQ